MSSSRRSTDSVPGAVDWTVAAATGTRLVRPGPEISAEGAAAVVASLRDSAQRAIHHVAEVTGLTAEPGRATPVLIVDRPRWVGATVDSFATLLAPLVDRLAARSRPSGLAAKASGVEVGALLAVLSSRVLGQYDPYCDDVVAGAPEGSAATAGQGRLLLIAPNIVAAERQLRVTPADFRLWVALHEQTHVVQFTHRPDGGEPWLRDHLRGLIERLLLATDLDLSALTGAVRGVAAKLREGRADELTVVDLVQHPEQRELLDTITGVMSLLEGHADVIMDRVGPGVIGSVGTIRSRFEARRARGGSDGLLRRLLGLDVKMRQYAEGAAFCRRVLERTDMATLNQAFAAPDRLPTLAEIGAPDRWLARVAG